MAKRMRAGARRLAESAARYGSFDDFMTTGVRLTRVVHAVACGDEDRAASETVDLVRRARREHLVRERGSK